MLAPLCPVVLSMLEARPRRVHEVSAELAARGLVPPGSSDPAARETLRRRAASHLVRRRVPGDGDQFVLTRRGRRELGLQRRLWRLASVTS